MRKGADKYGSQECEHTKALLAQSASPLVLGVLALNNQTSRLVACFGIICEYTFYF